MQNVQTKFRQVADAGAVSITFCSAFYKNDCFGKVLKWQTLQIALWGK